MCSILEDNILYKRRAERNVSENRVRTALPDIIEGLPGVLGNKGTLAKYRREQGNISQFLRTGNNIRKITVRKHSERVWEHGNIGQFWKGTREQGPPPPPPLGDPHN